MGHPSVSLDPAAARPTRVRWRIVGLLMAHAAVCHFNRISISVAGNERIMQQYLVAPTTMGVVYSAYLLTYTICMTPGGWLIDRRGPRAAFLLMGVGAAVFVALTGFAGTAFQPPLPFMAGGAVGLAGSAPGQGPLLAAAALVAERTLWTCWPLVATLMLIRSLLGIMSTPMHPGAARAVSFWMPAGARTWANGLVTGAALLGIAGTYTGFGYLMDRFGWQSSFVIAGGATALLAAVWALYASDRPTQHQSANAQECRLIEPLDDLSASPSPSAAAQRAVADRELTTLALLFRNRSLLMLTLSYAAVGYVQYLFFYWMQYYFDAVLKLGTEQSRLYVTAPSLAMAAGMFLGGWLSDRSQERFGARRGRALVAVLGMAASALLLVLGLCSGAPWWVVPCFTLSMASLGTCEGTFWTTAIELGGTRGGTSAAIFNTGGNAGGLLAPVVTPLFSAYFSWQAGIALASVVCLTGAVLWLWIDPAERTSRLTEPPAY
ncbi:MAG TPA: MFS transporter [Gemmataceae bacterium]|jgi:sugar phosphate permease|nr:MFS transporter [Gemmataceae bacterium]